MLSPAARVCRIAGQWTLIGGFAVALAVYCVKTYMNVAEDRNSLPKFRWENFKDWKDYPDDFTKFFEDRIAWKHLQVRRFARFKLETLGTSPTPRVWVGDDGWLFYNHEADKTYFAADNIRWAGRRDEWLMALPEWHKWLKERGIRFLMVVPPNKQSVYPEHLPPIEQKHVGASPFDELLAKLRMADPEFPILDLRDAVRAAKSKGQLYYKTDTHWTLRGHYYGYRATMSALAITPLAESDFRVTRDQVKAGDLPWQMGYWRLEQEPFENLTVINPRARSVPLANEESSDDKLQYLDSKLHVNDQRDLPKVLFFHDSFGFNDLLAEHCSRLLSKPSNLMDPDLIEREKPDIVVFEIVERLLQGVTPRRPTGPPPRSFSK